jgi:hypothetical protein
MEDSLDICKDDSDDFTDGATNDGV